jgi:hypothetical protein
VAVRLGVPEQAVQDRLAASRATGPQRRRRAPERPAEPAPELARPRPPGHEDWLLAIVVRHPELRDDLQELNSVLINDSLNRALFEAWREDPTLAAVESDEGHPLHARLAAVRAYRLPALATDQARLAMKQKLRTIVFNYLLQQRAAMNEQLAEAERNLGVAALEQVGTTIWAGESPPETLHEVADAFVQSLELGRSMHQWDDIL